jgi:tetratricopeptide (TPR) repeat protein
MDVAVEALERALSIDPEDAFANALAGAGQIYGENELEIGIRRMERALAREPNNPELLQWTGDITRALGYFDVSIELLTRAVRNDPLYNYCWYNLARSQYSAGHLDEAEASMRRYQALGVPGLGGWYTLGSILLLRGDAQGALEVFERARTEFRPDSPDSGEGVYLAHRALALYTLGRHEEFEATFAELLATWGEVNPREIAAVYAWTGDTDTAFEWVERSLEGLNDFEVRARFENQDPILFPLHDDPRYDALWARVGFGAERLAAVEFRLPPDPLAASVTP